MVRSAQKPPKRPKSEAFADNRPRIHIWQHGTSDFRFSYGPTGAHLGGGEEMGEAVERAMAGVKDGKAVIIMEGGPGA